MALKSMKPLTRAPLLHVSVQESLRAYVHDNGLAPGTLLPAEGELAAQLGVSRNSLREGIKALESLGILETRRGIGVFVKAFSFEPLLANLAYGLGGALREVEEVLEIRRVLEVGLIGKTIELIGEAVGGTTTLAFFAAKPSEVPCNIRETSTTKKAILK